MAMIASISAIWAPRWTGMIARVRVVMAASIFAGSMQYVSGSTSTITGTAPAAIGAEAVAWNVYAGTMTSSPHPMFAARNATSIVMVPLAMGTA